MEIKISKKPVKYEEAVKYLDERVQEVSQNKNEDTYKMYIEEGLHTDGKYKLVKTTQDILDQVPKEFL